MTKPRAITPEEGTNLLLNHFHDLVDYWANVNLTNAVVTGKGDTYERLNGLVFSILTTFDGSSMNMPAFMIVPCPHEDDQAFNQKNGENWWDYENTIGETDDGKGVIELHSRFIALGEERDNGK